MGILCIIIKSGETLYYGCKFVLNVILIIKKKTIVLLECFEPVEVVVFAPECNLVTLSAVFSYLPFQPAIDHCNQREEQRLHSLLRSIDPQLFDQQDSQAAKLPRPPVVKTRYAP